jgi:3-dehydroquinate dehydratase-1
MKSNICVSIARPHVDEVIRTMQGAEAEADLLEIRLDALETLPELSVFKKATAKPLLFTCRPGWEGGHFKGDEQQRLGILQKALAAGADFIDIELKAAIEMRRTLLDACSETSCRLLISWHDFSGTPSRQALMTIFQEMYRSGAHIGKIVTTARRFQDVLQVLSLQDEAEEMSFPLIAFCMGEKGRISRLATLELGGFMTYAAPDQGGESAPGQLKVSQLLTMLEILDHAD